MTQHLTGTFAATGRTAVLVAVVGAVLRLPKWRRGIRKLSEEPQRYAQKVSAQELSKRHRPAEL